MGCCNEVPKIENDDDKRRNNLIKDISINKENHNNELDSDEEVENFFNKNNEEKELSAFLVSIESIPYYNEQSSKEILFDIINSKNLEVYSDFEKCIDISSRSNDSHFFIVSKAYMKGKYKDFEEIKDKNVKIKKKKEFLKILMKKMQLNLKKKKMDYIALFLSLIILLML